MIDYKKNSYINGMNAKWSRNSLFWLRKGLKTARGKSRLFFCLCKPNDPNCSILLCIVRELAGGGSLALAVGVSDM